MLNRKIGEDEPIFEEIVFQLGSDYPPTSCVRDVKPSKKDLKISSKKPGATRVALPRTRFVKTARGLGHCVTWIVTKCSRDVNLYRDLTLLQGCYINRLT